MRLCALILAACAASTLNWNAPAAAAPAAAEQRLSHITVRSVGTGSPVVLIPGLASPSSVYDDLVAKFGKNHRLILVQVNGFAGSKPGPTDQLIPGIVDDLAGWLAANHVEKPAVIGHSMGGLIAMMLAAKHPDAAGKVMVVDALPFYGMLFGPTATPDAVRPIVEKMRDAMVSGTAPMDAPAGMTNQAATKAKIGEWLKASDRNVVGEALVEDAVTDIRPDLPSIKQPITVLYAVASSEQAAMTKAIYTDAYKAAPGTTLRGIDNSMHFIMLDQPAAFTAAVEDFLR